MNQKNVKILLERYKQNLKKMNDSTHDEIYKWDAVRYFQDNWDVDEDNFGAMFENAVSQGANLAAIGNHPVEGIIACAQYDEDAVRNIFREFFTEDGGDLKIREEKLQDFIDQTEELRKQFAKDRWRYAQDYVSATAYLGMFFPDENYLYHPEAVQRLSECIESGKNIVKGRNFSLMKYYKFCEQVREAIEKDPDIISMHNQFLRDSSYPDHRHHILTYDFIRGIYDYHLIDDCRVERRSGKAAQKEMDEQELKAEKLKTECEQCKAAYACVLDEIQQLSRFKIVGAQVTHKKYGQGIVKAQEGKRITVDFSGNDKAFLLPEAFSNHYLSVKGQPEVTAHYTKLAGKIKEEKELKNKIQLIEYELQL